MHVPRIRPIGLYTTWIPSLLINKYKFLFRDPAKNGNTSSLNLFPTKIEKDAFSSKNEMLKKLTKQQKNHSPSETIFIFIILPQKLFHSPQKMHYAKTHFRLVCLLTIHRNSSHEWLKMKIEVEYAKMTIKKTSPLMKSELRKNGKWIHSYHYSNSNSRKSKSTLLPYILHIIHTSPP